LGWVLAILADFARAEKWGIPGSWLKKDFSAEDAENCRGACGEEHSLFDPARIERELGHELPQVVEVAR
jgi:hypothetical protein